jgi:hypothetical protein
MPGGFNLNTRRKIIPVPALTKPSGGGKTEIVLPKSGILGGIYLPISVSVTGTLSSPNPLGLSSILRRVYLRTNSAIDLFNVSGPGYGFLLQRWLELQEHATSPRNNFGNGVVTGSYRLDMFIPVQINSGNTEGLLMLQDDQLQVTLGIDWEQDSSVATGATVTGTAYPSMIIYTVPENIEDYPPFDFIHQIIEDQYPIPASGDNIFDMLRNNIYLQVLMGAGFGVSSPSDKWSKLVVRFNSSDIIEQWDTLSMDAQYGHRLGVDRTAAPHVGTLALDWFGSDGLGNYGSARDFINSRRLTDFQLVLTASSAPFTFYVIRRMLVPFERPKG